MKIINFFAPAISIINKLKYPQKFLLISCIFIIPLSLMMYLLFSEVQSRIDFASQEQLGNTYLRPLRQLYPQIYKFQLLTANSPLGEEKVQLQQVKSQISEQLKSLEKVDHEIGTPLSTHELFQEVKESWKTLENYAEIWQGETQKIYCSIILEEMNKLRFQVGDQSNLILDPDLDTYYLMDATLLKLPEMQNILSNIMLISQNIIQQNKSELNQRYYLEITILLKILNDYNENLQRTMEISFNNNILGNLRPKLVKKFSLFTDNINNLNSNFKDIISNKNIKEIKAYSRQVNFYLEQSFSLWDETIDELDFLLQHRINGFIQKQFFLSTVVLITLLIVVYLFIGFYKSVMQTVDGLSIASQKMIAGEMNETLYLENQDELAEVVKSFNNLAIALVKANQEIMSLNQQLTSENFRMAAELQVTRQLQKMILPDEYELSEISQLDIAGYMEPADEVGGDYYDVLYNNGMVKIGIGDVTGHGLESGVLMLMVQTAVKTLIMTNETDPIRFLNTLNRVIYDNIQRMRSDKNLTFSLLDYYNGVLSICGQHEEMIVVRKPAIAQFPASLENHPLVERIDTIDLGFPIGLEADIEPFINSVNIKLNQGDGVVLYTDGITEAENNQGQLYGLERLCEVVQKHWHLTATEIRQAVIKDVRSHIGKHKVYDDITLVVLKQK